MDTWLKYSVAEIQSESAKFLESGIVKNREESNRRAKAFYWSMFCETATFFLLLVAVMLAILE